MFNQGSVCPINIGGDDIRVALETARSLPPNDFRRQEQAWLRDTLTPLLTATEIMYDLAAKEHDIVSADAALQGALLGGVVIRSLIDSGRVSSETCLHNLRSQLIGERGMRYDGEQIEDKIIAGVLGQEALDAIKEISTPAAQHMCAMVLGITLTPKSGSTT